MWPEPPKGCLKPAIAKRVLAVTSWIKVGFNAEALVQLYIDQKTVVAGCCFGIGGAMHVFLPGPRHLTSAIAGRGHPPRRGHGPGLHAAPGWLHLHGLLR